MTAQEFKLKYPHLAHLEGNELWDAMEMAVFKEQEPFEELPDDHEIAHTEKMNGYTINFTKGAMRMFAKLEEGSKPLEMINPTMYFVPAGKEK